MNRCPFPFLESPVPPAERDNDPLTETTLAARLFSERYFRITEEDVRLLDGSLSKRYSITTAAVPP